MSTVPLGFVATLIVHKSIISAKKVRLCNEATNFNQTLTFFSYNNNKPHEDSFKTLQFNYFNITFD